MSLLDVQRIALWWGPGILVLVAFGYWFLRLAHYWIEKTMEVRRQQTDAAYGLVRQYIEQFLGAQSGQADALSRLASSVEHRETKESFEHQEILIALKALHRDMESLHCSSREDFCVLRGRAGLSGGCNSSSELTKVLESRAPALDSPCARPRGQVADKGTLETEGVRVSGRRAETSRDPASSKTPGPDLGLGNMF